MVFAISPARNGSVADYRVFRPLVFLRERRSSFLSVPALANEHTIRGAWRAVLSAPLDQAPRRVCQVHSRARLRLAHGSTSAASYACLDVVRNSEETKSRRGQVCDWKHVYASAQTTKVLPASITTLDLLRRPTCISAAAFSERSSLSL